MHNQFVWVDIPVADLERAMAFYSAVLDAEMTVQSFAGFRLSLLPHDKNSVAGCLYQPQNNDNQPSPTGPLLYLNVDGRLDSALSAVRKSAGKVLQDRHQIGEHGYRAIILDSEGNRLALHSVKD